MSIQQRPILIIDSFNLYARSYAAYPTMSMNGYQMGGCIGFLKTLSRIVLETQPRQIYVVWEGGGSTKRRALYSEYKLSKKPEKLNRFYEDDLPDTEENKKYQVMSLLKMLKKVPVCQLYAADCEGDDLIAYLCMHKFKQDDKIIVSTDKDMYQLLDLQTKIYNLSKKRVVTKKEIESEFRISTKNFALAKALCGDVSDNIPGIKGLGFKKAVKYFPMLGIDSDVLLQDIFDYCHTHVDEHKVYQSVISLKEDIKRNWRLVYLDGGMIPAQEVSKIDNVLNTFVPHADRIGLMRHLIDEGINDFNIEDFFFSFRCINNVVYNTVKR